MFGHKKEKNSENIENNIEVNDEVKPKKKRNGLKTVGFIVAFAVFGTVVGAGASYKLYIDKQAKTSSEKQINPPTAEQLSSVSSLTTSDVFEKVKPAVVTISVKSIADNGGYSFWNQSQEVEGIGSGFIINKKGYIVTNYHVIEGSTSVKVLLSTGKELDATIVNYNQQMDLAVIKLPEGTKVPGVVELGDSDAIYSGQEVLAIGTPLSKDYAQTCTKGVISASNRKVSTSDGTVMEVIQTDAAINPGNSGGPLVDAEGKVIGINSMKLVESEVEGIGFSIPINNLKSVLDELSTPSSDSGDGEVNLGIEVKNSMSGVKVTSVTKDSIADQVGIKQGDIIVAFDGKKISNTNELVDIKKNKKSGDIAQITIERDGKEKTIMITLR